MAISGSNERGLGRQLNRVGERARGMMPKLGFKAPARTLSILIIVFWVVIAAIGPRLTPYTATEIDVDHMLQPPSASHLLGTDHLGRDVLTRVLLGSRSILILAPSAVLIALLLGTAIGLISGYYGGLVDESIMRFMDTLMAVPTLLLNLLMLVALGASLRNVILVLGIVYTPRIARVVRSSVLDLVTREFVAAARVRGESDIYIMVREILPNATGPITVEGATRLGYAIFAAASLGYLGMGVQPPSPDWGLMVSEARTYITFAPWTVAFPALAISSLVIAVNMLADTLRQGTARSFEEV